MFNRIEKNGIWAKEKLDGLWEVGLTEETLAGLKEVVFMSMPVQEFQSAGTTLMIVEGLKTTFEVQLPFSCTPVAMNDELPRRPNQWILRVDVHRPECIE